MPQWATSFKEGVKYSRRGSFSPLRELPRESNTMLLLSSVCLGLNHMAMAQTYPSLSFPREGGEEGGRVSFSDTRGKMRAYVVEYYKQKGDRKKPAH